MKLRKSIFLALVLVIGLVFLAGCGGSDNTGSENGDKKEAMKPVTLKFADLYPNTHPASVAVLQEWMKRVEAATDGLVKVDYYPAGTLAKPGDIYEAVASGIADVGHDVSGYNVGRLPVFNAMYVGGVEYKGAKASSYIARDLMNELQPKELNDTQLMFPIGISPGVLMTTKPVRTLEDLKGMQIRASGANVDTLKALGAVPVGIAVNETYDSMSKGVVDGALLPPEALVGFKIGEVSKYLTETTNLYNTVNYVTMNKDVWNSFPKEIQDAINKVNEEIFEIAANLWEGKDGLNQKGYDFALEKGNQMVTLSDEEVARWTEKLQPLKDDYAKVLDGKGIDGKAVMKRIVELSEKYNKEFYPEK